MEEKMAEVKETINELLVEIFNHILFIEEKYIKGKGVTISMTEIHILENVEKSETKTLSDVARLQGVTPGTLSVAVNSLVRKGYLLKCKDISDKRIIRLIITPKSSEVLKIHSHFHERMVEYSIRDLDLEKEQEMMAGLQKIVEYFRVQIFNNGELYNK